MELPDYKEMAEILSTVKSKFILSINDLPEMREAFKGLKSRPVKLKYSVSRGKWSDAKELLITNF